MQGNVNIRHTRILTRALASHQLKECFIQYPNTSKWVETTLLCLFSVWISGETLMFDILHERWRAPEKAKKNTFKAEERTNPSLSFGVKPEPQQRELMYRNTVRFINRTCLVKKTNL
jgi:hypothetical protein